MRRRQFVGLVGGAAIWPVFVRAQQGKRLRRIGVLVGGAGTDSEQGQRLTMFRQTLRDLGWIEGRDITIGSHYTTGETAHSAALVKEVIERQYDVILAATTPVVAALQQATRTVPIIFVNVSDPVGSGFVESLARPGTNATGFINIESSLGGKWLELLQEISPYLTRVAVMFNPATAPQSDYYLRPLENTARSLGVELIVAHVRSDSEIEKSMAALGLKPGSGLIVIPDFFAAAHRKQIILQAARNRVSAIYPFSFFAADDGLVSYGVDLIDSYRRAAGYVDRILKGDKPADLPVQVPIKFELVINLKTAKALGLIVPPTLLARATEVIE